MSIDDMREVTLIGCGNVGFRHLEALCGMSPPAHITVVEPNQAVHQRITGQFRAAGSSHHAFDLATALPDCPDPVDLLVVATTADVRRSVVEAAVARGPVRTAILEKVLFQTVGDTEQVGVMLDRHGIATFVNYARRTFGGYHELRDRCANRRPVHLSVAGNRFGMASNALHFLDLAEFITGSTLTVVDPSGLDAESVPGRRPDTIEIFGTLRAELADGSTLTVDCRDDDPIQISVTVTAADERYVIDELTRTITDGRGASAPFAAQNVSETLHPYEDLLNKGCCELTPYADSARQHRYFLDALRGHLGLSVIDDEPCPIT